MGADVSIYGPRERVRRLLVALIHEDLPFSKLALRVNEAASNLPFGSELDSASNALCNALLGASDFFDQVESERAMRDGEPPEDWNYVKTIKAQLGSLDALYDRRKGAERTRLLRQKLVQIAITTWMAYERTK